jgi:hypothetical protein
MSSSTAEDSSTSVPRRTSGTNTPEDVVTQQSLREMNALAAVLDAIATGSQSARSSSHELGDPHLQLDGGAEAARGTHWSPNESNAQQPQLEPPVGSKNGGVSSFSNHCVGHHGHTAACFGHGCS